MKALQSGDSKCCVVCSRVTFTQIFEFRVDWGAWGSQSREDESGQYATWLTDAPKHRKSVNGK